MNGWRRVVAALAAALLAACLTGWVTRPTPPPDAGSGASLMSGSAPSTPTAPRASASAAAVDRAREATAPPAGSRLRARPAKLPTERPAARPTVLAIPRLDLRLPVRPGGVDRAGAMQLPGTVREVSWYRYGPAPSDPGATVIAGHVDTREEGIGPLAGLGTLRAGDRIEVETDDGATAYEVSAVRQIDKSVLDLDRLFSRSGESRLHLITCSGAYDPDRGGYQANLVVVARALRG